jgi:hypothetical protein
VGVDEPTNWELARQLSDIKQMITAVVGHPEYAADRRALDYRLSELQLQLETERRERANDVKAVNDRLDKQAEAGVEHRMHWRSLLWTGALPAAVALLGVLITLWIAHNGGGGH